MKKLIQKILGLEFTIILLKLLISNHYFLFFIFYIRCGDFDGYLLRFQVFNTGYNINIEFDFLFLIGFFKYLKPKIIKILQWLLKLIK